VRAARPGRLDLAVADDIIKKNPAKSRVIQAPSQVTSEIQVWADQIVICLIDTHLNRCVLCLSLQSRAECGKVNSSALRTKTSTLTRKSSGSGGR
jgi:hypothetical protein